MNEKLLLPFWGGGLGLSLTDFTLFLGKEGLSFRGPSFLRQRAEVVPGRLGLLLGREGRKH